MLRSCGPARIRACEVNPWRVATGQSRRGRWACRNDGPASGPGPDASTAGSAPRRPRPAPRLRRSARPLQRGPCAPAAPTPSAPPLSAGRARAARSVRPGGADRAPLRTAVWPLEPAPGGGGRLRPARRPAGAPATAASTCSAARPAGARRARGHGHLRRHPRRARRRGGRPRRRPGRPTSRSRARVAVGDRGRRRRRSSARSQLARATASRAPACTGACRGASTTSTR